MRRFVILFKQIQVSKLIYKVSAYYKCELLVVDFSGLSELCVVSRNSETQNVYK